jgi:post-segregation antitoxin (ccd killing protein)
MKTYNLGLVLLFVSLQALQASQISHRLRGRLNDLVTQSLGIDSIPIGHDVYMSFRRAARLKGIDVTMPQDEFHHLYQLEKFFKMSDMITQKTGFIRGNSAACLLHYRLVSHLMHTDYSSHAITLWRSLEQEYEIDPKWKEARAITETPRSDIEQLHRDVHAYNKIADDIVIPDLVRRLYGTSAYSHKSCDDRQAAQKKHPLRSVEASEEHGLWVEIPRSKFQQIRDVAHSSAPLIESLKNKRFLTISGLRNSKVSLLVHDHFDHAFTFALLKQEGVLERYKNFLQQVGNPHLCDILSREGELIASKQLSLLSYNQILSALTEGHIMSENQQKAHEILKQNKDNSSYINQFLVVASGVYIELMQQRVKNGVIKVLDNEKNQVDVLRTMDPEYFALMIEVFDCMHKHKPYVHKQLLNSQLMVEDLLHKALKEDARDLAITVSGRTVSAFDREKSVIPAHRADWIERNLGAISDRNPIIS